MGFEPTRPVRDSRLAVERIRPTLPTFHLNLAVGVRFELTEVRVTNLAGFQDQCNKPDSANLPFNTFLRIKMSINYTFLRVIWGAISDLNR